MIFFTEIQMAKNVCFISFTEINTGKMGLVFFAEIKMGNACFIFLTEINMGTYMCLTFFSEIDTGKCGS